MIKIKNHKGKEIVLEEIQDQKLENKYSKEPNLTWWEYKDDIIAKWKFDKQGNLYRHKFKGGMITEQKYDRQGTWLWTKYPNGIYYLKNGKKYKEAGK